MDKKEKVKKEPFIKTVKRIDGSQEIIVSKAPQKTIVGKIIVILLAVLLGGSTIATLIFTLLQLI